MRNSFLLEFFFDYSVFCCFPSMIQNKKSMAQITAPCPNKRKPYSQNRKLAILILLILVLRILRIKVGPTAHPVAAIEGSDVAYGVETCPASETCSTEQWASCYRSIAICTNGIHTSEIYILKLELAILGILHDGKVVNLRTWDDVEGECPGISLRTRHCFSVHPHIVITLRQWCYGRKSVAFFGNLNLEKLALIR